MNEFWNLEDTLFLQSSLADKGESIQVVIGENGAGKSLLLDALARNLTREGKKVLLVCNSFHNKFSSRSKLADRTLIQSPKRKPLDILKKVIVEALVDFSLPVGLQPSQSLEKRRFGVGTAFESAGFEPVLGIRVELTSKARELFLNQEKWSLLLENLESKFLDVEQYTKSHPPRGAVLAMESLLRLFNEFKQSERFNLHLVFTENLYRNYYSEIFFLFKYERLLKKEGYLKGLTIRVMKGEEAFSFEQASSGELSKIAMAAYIASVAENGLHIIIDEPENSLHPTWQRSFIENLRAAIGYYECNITIATHSPLIAAGAKLARSPSNEDGAKLLHCENFKLTRKRPESLAVDSLLETHFNVIGPESHHLSKLLVELLDSLENEKISIAIFAEQIKELKEKTFSGTRQERAFEAAREFAKNIQAEKKDEI